jgi:hypothetical protein
MPQSSDAFEKKETPSKSADELVRLILKLNAKLRDKLSLSRKKKSPAPQTDVVIILMTHRNEPARPEKKPPAVKTPVAPADWLENLFAEIEGSFTKRRKTS